MDDILAAQGCADNWVEFEDICYFYSRERMNWTNAEQHCRDLNSHLLSITSQQEQIFVNSKYGIALFQLICERWIVSVLTMNPI